MASLSCNQWLVMHQWHISGLLLFSFCATVVWGDLLLDSMDWFGLLQQPQRSILHCISFTTILRHFCNASVAYLERSTYYGAVDILQHISSVLHLILHLY